MVVFVFLMLTEFAAYYNNPEMAALLDTIPPSLLAAFGMQGANLTTVSGYFSVMVLYFYIMLGIYAILLGSNIIAKEERDKTAEFLLTMPVTREKVMVSKLVASVINCVILTMVTGGGWVLATWQYDPDGAFYEFLSLSMLATLMLMLIFLSIGFCLAAIMKRFKLSGTLSVSVIISMYFLSVIVALSDSVDFLKYLTPFKYFEAVRLLHDRSFDAVYLVLTGVIIVLALTGAFLVYPKRDLKV